METMSRSKRAIIHIWGFSRTLLPEFYIIFRAPAEECQRVRCVNGCIRMIWPDLTVMQDQQKSIIGSIQQV